MWKLPSEPETDNTSSGRASWLSLVCWGADRDQVHREKSFVADHPRVVGPVQERVSQGIMDRAEVFAVRSGPEASNGPGCGEPFLPNTLLLNSGPGVTVQIRLAGTSVNREA